MPRGTEVEEKVGEAEAAIKLIQFDQALERLRLIALDLCVRWIFIADLVSQDLTGAMLRRLSV